MNQAANKNITTNRTSDLLQQAGELLTDAAGLLMQTDMRDMGRMLARQATIVLEEARVRQWQDALANPDHPLNQKNTSLPAGKKFAEGGVSKSFSPSTGVAIYSDAKKNSNAYGVSTDHTAARAANDEVVS